MESFTRLKGIAAPLLRANIDTHLQLPARGSWYGLFVPRKTPAEVVAKIEKLVMALANDSPAAAVIRGLGAEPVFGSSRDFAVAIHEEDAFLAGLVKQYPLK